MWWELYGAPALELGTRLLSQLAPFFKLLPYSIHEKPSGVRRGSILTVLSSAPILSRFTVDGSMAAMAFSVSCNWKSLAFWLKLDLFPYTFNEIKNEIQYLH